MYQRDYLMRLIEQLTRVLARIIFLKDAGKYEEALVDIEANGEKYLGLRWSMIGQMSAEQLVEWLKLGGTQIDLNRATAVAEFLRYEAAVLALQKEEDRSFDRNIKAFALFEEVLLQYPLPELREMAADVLRKIEEFELPESIETRRIRFLDGMDQGEGR